MRATQLDKDPQAFSRKDIRLPGQKYLGKQLYFVTICCNNRLPAFSKRKLAARLIEYLLRTAAAASFSIHAYCVMPDHVHILAEGLHESSDLLRFISSFKQKTGFAHKKATGRTLWQPKYYDHILRKADELESVATYIWLNPARKNLCEAPQDYPYSGSQTFDWKKRLAPRPSWTPPWRVRREDAGLKPGSTKAR